MVPIGCIPISGPLPGASLEDIARDRWEYFQDIIPGLPFFLNLPDRVSILRAWGYDLILCLDANTVKDSLLISVDPSAIIHKINLDATLVLWLIRQNACLSLRPV